MIKQLVTYFLYGLIPFSLTILLILLCNAAPLIFVLLLATLIITGVGYFVHQVIEISKE